jgi:glycine cleavage system regulatory protein
MENEPVEQEIAAAIAKIRDDIPRAIAHELLATVAAADDIELARELARECAIAAGKAIEPALARLAVFMALSVQLQAQLAELHLVINALEPGSGRKFQC